MLRVALRVPARAGSRLAFLTSSSLSRPQPSPAEPSPWPASGSSAAVEENLSSQRMGSSASRLLVRGAPPADALLRRVLEYVEFKGGSCSSRDLGRSLDKDALPPAWVASQVHHAAPLAAEAAAESAVGAAAEAAGQDGTAEAAAAPSPPPPPETFLAAIRAAHGGVNAFLRRHPSLFRCATLDAPASASDPRGLRRGVTVALTPVGARLLLKAAKLAGDAPRAMAALGLLRRSLNAQPLSGQQEGEQPPHTCMDVQSLTAASTTPSVSGALAPLPTDYALAIGSCKSKGLWREALAMVRLMDAELGLASGCTPSAQVSSLPSSFNADAGGSGGSVVVVCGGGAVSGRPFAVCAAISACARAGRWREALALLRTLDHRPADEASLELEAPASGRRCSEHSGVRGRVDVACFGAALDACAQSGRATEALELLLVAMPRCEAGGNSSSCVCACVCMCEPPRLRPC